MPAQTLESVVCCSVSRLPAARLEAVKATVKAPVKAAVKAAVMPSTPVDAFARTTSRWLTGEPSAEGEPSAADATACLRADAALPEDHRLCVICLETVSSEDDATYLSCAHVYHRACIGRWLQRAPRCPQCGVAAGPLAAGSLDSCLQSAEANLSAARRINLRAAADLRGVIAHGSGSSQGLAMLERLGEAEAAAHAASAQLRALEAQLLGASRPATTPAARSPYAPPAAGPSAARHAERQRRNATQQVRAQLRVAERQTPRMVRPSKR